MRLIDADNFAKTLSEMHGEGDYEANVYCAEPVYGSGKWIWKDPEDYGIQMAEEALGKEPTILEWNEFKLREMDDEEKEYYEYYSELSSQFMLYGKLPDDDEEILVSDGKQVWFDIFHIDAIDGCWLETNIDLEEGMAWMPLPKPHKKRENEE